MNPGRDNLVFTDALLGRLAALGVRFAVCSPGSRNTPLVVSAWRCPGIKVLVAPDERGACYLAAGAAKSSGVPTALICTSGTAAANYLPGVVEASLSGVPIILLTADRPPELRDSGAPQAIDQVKLYGSHVRWSHDAGVPGSTRIPVHEYADSLAVRAYALSSGYPRGPVHLNLPFQQPFLPDDIPPFREPAQVLHAESPFTYADSGALEAVEGLLRTHERGWIVCGPIDDDSLSLAESLQSLAQYAGYPILADAAAPVRFGPGSSLAAGAYDALLRISALEDNLAPSVVLHFGAAPSSKVLQQFLHRRRPVEVVFDSGLRWTDPGLRGKIHIRGPAAAFLKALNDRIGDIRAENPWGARFLEYNRRTQNLLDRHFESSAGFHEPAVAAAVIKGLPPGAQLFVSSSMPIRDLDWFGGTRTAPLKVLANRGANGIDGILSSALGAAAASSAPTYLLTGDLACLHDLNALVSARLNELSLTVVLINNDGGGIFRHLPIASRKDPFLDPCFYVRHGLSMEPLVRGFGVEYRRPENTQTLREALADPPAGVQVLEITTSADAAVGARESAWRLLERELAGRQD
ncbi:MAG: 2-succinyl-5-enolpyruvyl-6-hydroxy-3-cyclohexene-1-carboxylic-acid synthase [Acidobacteriota bacterium]